MDDGDGEIRICQNCGEAVWLSYYEEDLAICPNCGEVVSFFQGGD